MSGGAEKKSASQRLFASLFSRSKKNANNDGNSKEDGKGNNNGGRETVRTLALPKSRARRGEDHQHLQPTRMVEIHESKNRLYSPGSNHGNKLTATSAYHTEPKPRTHRPTRSLPGTGHNAASSSSRRHRFGAASVYGGPTTTAAIASVDEEDEEEEEEDFGEEEDEDEDFEGVNDGHFGEEARRGSGGARHQRQRQYQSMRAGSLVDDFRHSQQQQSVSTRSAYAHHGHRASSRRPPPPPQIEAPIATLEASTESGEAISSPGGPGPSSVSHRHHLQQQQHQSHQLFNAKYRNGGAFHRQHHQADHRYGNETANRTIGADDSEALPTHTADGRRTFNQSNNPVKRAKYEKLKKLYIGVAERNLALEDEVCSLNAQLRHNSARLETAVDEVLVKTRQLDVLRAENASLVEQLRQFRQQQQQQQSASRHNQLMSASMPPPALAYYNPHHPSSMCYALGDGGPSPVLASSHTPTTGDENHHVVMTSTPGQRRVATAFQQQMLRQQHQMQMLQQHAGSGAGESMALQSSSQLTGVVPSSQHLQQQQLPPLDDTFNASSVSQQHQHQQQQQQQPAFSISNLFDTTPSFMASFMAPGGGNFAPLQSSELFPIVATKEHNHQQQQPQQHPLRTVDNNSLTASTSDAAAAGGTLLHQTPDLSSATELARKLAARDGTSDRRHHKMDGCSNENQSPLSVNVAFPSVSHQDDEDEDDLNADYSAEDEPKGSLLRLNEETNANGVNDEQQGDGALSVERARAAADGDEDELNVILPSSLSCSHLLLLHRPDETNSASELSSRETLVELVRGE